MSQISNKIDRNIHSFPIFKIFMQFLSQFRQTSRIEILKTFTKVATRSSVVFKDEIKSVFLIEKSLNLTPKLTKPPKIFKFQKFYAVFSEFSTNAGDWNIGSSSQGVNWISSMLSGEINAVL